MRTSQKYNQCARPLVPTADNQPPAALSTSIRQHGSRHFIISFQSRHADPPRKNVDGDRVVIALLLCIIPQTREPLYGPRRGLAWRRAFHLIVLPNKNNNNNGWSAIFSLLCPLAADRSRRKPRTYHDVRVCWRLLLGCVGL